MILIETARIVYLTATTRMCACTWASITNVEYDRIGYTRNGAAQSIEYSDPPRYIAMHFYDIYNLRLIPKNLIFKWHAVRQQARG